MAMVTSRYVKGGGGVTGGFLSGTCLNVGGGIDFRGKTTKTKGKWEGQLEGKRFLGGGGKRAKE